MVKHVPDNRKSPGCGKRRRDDGSAFMCTAVGHLGCVVHSGLRSIVSMVGCHNLYLHADPGMTAIPTLPLRSK
ncbi:hypothetical protein ANCDUO_01640 [Ancylostoma duodenale]|uniref:Uncharacterized protein n=1 Tax=Ancylostoma duodenale TaxID=51022 RepID=A0A0C2H2K7_9BILA|nr:hypothetical protein ANCDUO_01640 [Ancylostoma duodenale]